MRRVRGIATPWNRYCVGQLLLPITVIVAQALFPLTLLKRVVSDESSTIGGGDTGEYACVPVTPRHACSAAESCQTALLLLDP